MSESRDALEQRLLELRAGFDASFARAAEPPAAQRRGYLGIRLGDAPYALDLDEVAAVRKHVPVTPLPSEEPRLLGVAGFGGVLTAVYDLGALVGHAGEGEPTWFVLARGAPIAFAFQGLEGQLQVDAEQDVASGAPADATSELQFRAGLARPVIRLGALVARIRGGAQGRVEGDASK